MLAFSLSRTWPALPELVQYIRPVLPYNLVTFPGPWPTLLEFSRLPYSLRIPLSDRVIHVLEGWVCAEPGARAVILRGILLAPRFLQELCSLLASPFSRTWPALPELVQYMPLVLAVLDWLLSLGLAQAFHQSFIPLA